jgi:hypothetical protein
VGVPLLELPGNLWLLHVACTCGGCGTQVGPAHRLATCA